MFSLASFPVLQVTAFQQVSPPSQKKKSVLVSGLLIRTQRSVHLSALHFTALTLLCDIYYLLSSPSHNMPIWPLAPEMYGTHKALYAFVIFSMCPVFHIIEPIYNLIILTRSEKQHKLWSSSLLIFAQCPVASTLLSPTTLNHPARNQLSHLHRATDTTPLLYM